MWWDLDMQAWVALLVVVVALGLVVGACLVVFAGWGPPSRRRFHGQEIPAAVTAVKDRHGRVWCREAGEPVWGNSDGALRYTAELDGPLREQVRRPDL